MKSVSEAVEAPETDTPFPVLETRRITKIFARVVANKDVSISLRRGEIVAILGENGAGKTTLMNILFGLYRPSSGEILLDGRPVAFDSPRDAIRHGLGMVHQHFMLVGTLTVAQNIILGEEPVSLGHIRYGEARRGVAELGRRYHLGVDPDARIEDLSVGMQQRVEILKALYRNARILILDEPTGVLTGTEVEELFTVLKGLASQGTSILIITHKLEEVKRLSDRVYILRRGVVAGERRTSEVQAPELASLMIGREVVLHAARSRSQVSSEPVLTARGLQVRSVRGFMALRGCTFSVRSGDILGLAGVEGNGQKELADALVGLSPIERGALIFKGEDISRLSVNRRLLAGMGAVPQDRRGAGLVLPFSIEENLLMGASDLPPFSRKGLLNFSAIRRHGEQLMKSFDIRAAGPAAAASTLSGGNQQKVVLAREFSREPAFLLVCQPARGLDVGATEYVYSRIRELRDGGTAILLISMELEEIFALSGRIAVLHEGRIVFEKPTPETNEVEVGEYMIRGLAEKRIS
jgi:general nucleoside transport system ATP-binding protein